MRATFLLKESLSSTELAVPGAITTDVRDLADRCLPGLNALNWLLEGAEWISPIDRKLGKMQASWRAVHAMAEFLGEALTGSEGGRSAFAAARDMTAREVSIEVVCDEQHLVKLPWELATISTSKDGTPIRLCEVGTVVRIPLSRLNGMAQPLLPPLRILSIVPRPFGFEDVGISGTQGPLVAAATAWPHLIKLKLLRPSTWEALQEELEQNDNYDVIHFDGHGIQRADGRVALAFEGSGQARSRGVSAQELADSLAPVNPKLIILAACRSAGSSGNAVSISFELARSLSPTQVLGMSHSVTTDTVRALLSTFLPRLLATGSAVTATGDANRDLFQSWLETKGEGRPDYLVPVIFGSPQASADERPIGTWDPPDRHSVTNCLLTREYELLSFDRVVHQSGQSIELIGPIQSGKTTFLSAYRQYLKLTGSPLVSQNDGKLNVELRESSDITTKRLPGSFSLQDPPPRIGASWITELMERGLLEREPPTLGSVSWELISYLGAHFGSMALFETLAAHLGVRESLEEIRWGTGVSVSSEQVDAVQRRISQLDADTRRRATVLGVYDHAVIPFLLSVVSDGLMYDSSYELIFGGTTSAEEWVEVLNTLLAMGLCHDARTGSLRVYVIPPIVSYVLRQHLNASIGPENIVRLQNDVGRAVQALAMEWGRRTSGDGTVSAYNREESRLAMTTALEANVDRSLGFYIRQAWDKSAAQLALGWLSNQMPGASAFDQVLAVLRHRLAYEHEADRCYALQAVFYDSLSHDAEAREQWESGLLHVNRSLQLQESLEQAVLNPVFQYIRQARCLWRTGETDDAKRALSTAASFITGESERVAVAVAEDDMRLFLGDHTNSPAEVIADQPVDEVLWYRQLEDSGDLAGVLEYWVSKYRESGLRMDRRQMADNLLEIGRLKTLMEDETGVADLMRSLRIRYQIGMAVERNLYLLGMAREAAGDLEGATDALDAAWEESERRGTEGNRADILYERGLVWLARAQQASESSDEEAFVATALGYLEQARTAYHELLRPVHEADALMMMVQIKFALGDELAARALFAEALEIGGQGFRDVREELITNVAQMIGNP